MKKISLVLISLFALMFVISCQEDKKVESEPVTLPTKSGSEIFYQVQFDLPVRVSVQRSETKSYEVFATEADLKKVMVDIHKGRLKFGIRKGERLEETVKINIRTSNLESVKMNGSGRVEIAAGTMAVEKASLIVTGSGTIRADLKEQKILNTVLAGSGRLELTGRTEEADIAISGSGDVLALGLSSKLAKVNISGSGECQIHVTDTLDVTIAGSGDVYYKGEPEISRRMVGSGQVLKKE
ncbi:MAG: head GIN domain-containing protein [Saprospiraceae bacterium]|nr:head GIN domain-containing protein [Saprospiraceae bacterium]